MFDPHGKLLFDSGNLSGDPFTVPLIMGPLSREWEII
jgi:hypothetical protein